MTKTSIVFFGSGPVATESLKFLVEAFDVEAVITKPKPPHHRGTMSTIEACKGYGIPCFTPKDKAELDDLFGSQKFSSPVGIVIDYGIIISRRVIDSFPCKIVNSHFSLLPAWRGADPITFALLAGDETTGVSLMIINEHMDEGLLLAQQSLSITASDTSKTLTTKLIQLSNLLLSKHLSNYVEGSLKPYEQQGPVTYSRKLTKQDGAIDWTKSASQIEREIRAYYDWPRSYTTLSGHRLIIRTANLLRQQGPPGTFEVQDNSLIVYCKKDALQITRLQPAGKKEMTTKAFLVGNSLE